ncbi:hypothetical protein [Allocoleopsis sp.]
MPEVSFKYWTCPSDAGAASVCVALKVAIAAFVAPLEAIAPLAAIDG